MACVILYLRITMEVFTYTRDRGRRTMLQCQETVKDNIGVNP